MIELGLKIPQNWAQEKKTLHEYVFSKIYPFISFNVKGRIMGIRSAIKKKIKKILDGFSGEFSDAAPEERTPYTKGVKDENVEVVMAKLRRPKAKS